MFAQATLGGGNQGSDRRVPDTISQDCSGREVLETRLCEQQLCRLPQAQVVSRSERSQPSGRAPGLKPRTPGFVGGEEGGKCSGVSWAKWGGGVQGIEPPHQSSASCSVESFTKTDLL